MNKMKKERAVLSIERLDRFSKRFWNHNISAEVIFSVRFKVLSVGKYIFFVNSKKYLGFGSTWPKELNFVVFYSVGIW